MPVRGLEAYLRENGLIRTEPIASLTGLRVGVDATHWLKSRVRVKEVFQVATGGAPLSLRTAVDADVALFKKGKISPLWVFSGLLVPMFHRGAVSGADPRLDMRKVAWNHYLSGHPAASKSNFEASFADKSLAMSFSGLVFWHLLNSNEETFRAPMLPWSQLVYFLEPSQRQHPGHAALIHAIYGPTEVLVTGASSLILSLHWEEGTFEWTDLPSVLRHTGLSYSQFQDACILAGFDGCPGTNFKNARYLGFEAYVEYVKHATQVYREQMGETTMGGVEQGSGAMMMETSVSGQLGASEGVVADGQAGERAGAPATQSDSSTGQDGESKKASGATLVSPLLFPVTNPELYLSVLHDVDRMLLFRRAKILINHPLVLSQEGVCAPENRALLALSDAGVNLDQVLGKPIPNEAYWLLSRGCIGAQVMNNLLTGIMLEAPPLISSPSYEAYLEDLLELRERTLALVSGAIGWSYGTLDVVMVRWFAENKVLQHINDGSYAEQPRDLIIGQEVEYTREYFLQHAEREQRTAKTLPGTSDFPTEPGKEPGKEPDKESNREPDKEPNGKPALAGMSMDYVEIMQRNAISYLMQNPLFRDALVSRRSVKVVDALESSISKTETIETDGPTHVSTAHIATTAPFSYESCLTFVLQLILNREKYTRTAKSNRQTSPSTTANHHPATANELYANLIAYALELSGYATPHYSALTHWGHALYLIDPLYIESGFVVLELLKAKRLNSVQLIPNPLDEDLEPEIILSTRIFSLLRMQLHNHSWCGPIDQDLLAFNSLIRACFRTLRNLFEMVSLNFVLSRCIQADAKDYQLVSRQLFWVQEASTALGMVFKALAIEGPTGLSRRFSTCIDIKHDLYRGVAFWKSVYLAITYLSEVNQIDPSIKQEFDRAHLFVLQQEKIIPMITA